MTSFAPTLIALNAAFFVLYGLAFVIVPDLVATTVTEGAPRTSSGMIDLRATYGGMTIAVGLVLAALARAPSTHAAGLRAVALVLLCMAAARTIGILIDGDPNGWMWLFLAGELIFAARALFALRALAEAPR